ncbi:hypothetical protein ABFG95_11895 [Achromobacter sp. HNDS-1]|uniref:Phage tail fiber protein n=1 Tax=Achromobacter sp. HNDS-1 TaxID=3151598 RepID=A0AAU7LGX5_9BURK
MQELEQIRIGQHADDGTGDALRDGMAKVNDNFAKVKQSVEAVESTAASAAEVAAEAKAKADGDIPAAAKGMAGGVAPLDDRGKVPAAHLPPLTDYLPADEKGAPGGVAPLDDRGKVPAAHLPPLTGYLSVEDRGQIGGVAPLDADGRIPEGYSSYPATRAYLETDFNDLIWTDDYYVSLPVPNSPPALRGEGLLRVRELFDGQLFQEFFLLDAKPARWWRSKLTLTTWGQWQQVAEAARTMGPDQALVDVTGSRAINVSYVNSTGRPIVAYVRCVTQSTGSTGHLSLQLGNPFKATDICHVPLGAGVANYLTVSAIIPPGVQYMGYAFGTGLTFDLWKEYR